MENYDVLKEFVSECIDELLYEKKFKKYVIKGGKKKKVVRTDMPNEKVVGGKLKRMGAEERIKRKRSSKIAVKKRKSKQHRINKKRAKSMKKRITMGLR